MLATAVRAVVGLVIVLAAAFLTRDPARSSRPSRWPCWVSACSWSSSFGLGIALAPLGALYPDLKPGLGSALTLLTFASPILFPESALGPAARGLVEWNPFTHLLRLHRFPLGLPGAALHARDVLAPAALALVLFGAGSAVKARYWWRARDVL